MPEPLLAVDGLSVEFRTEEGVVKAVEGVGYSLEKGEVLAILGESGSGKTVHARAIMRILDSPPAHITAGTAKLDDTDVLTISEAEMREVRGAKIAMLFQDPHTALDPVFTVGSQLVELLCERQGLSRGDAKQISIELLDRVGIATPKERMKAYPHELSGGIAQRVMVAMAVALEPEVLLADEPTSSLDVTVQAQVLELLDSLVSETEMAMVLITHNLAVAVAIADRIAVMYAGRMVELGPARDVYAAPKHPYTVGLLHAIPDIQIREDRLPGIKGTPPNMLRLPSGCAFHPRCPLADERCRVETPVFEQVAPSRWSACFHADEVVR